MPDALPDALPEPGRDDEPCVGCPACLPHADRTGMALPEPFVVVGYGRPVGDELLDPDTPFVDAWGMWLPDGRAVTCAAPGRATEPLRVWERPARAASHWGGYLLWPGRVSGAHRDALRCGREPISAAAGG